MPTTPLRVSQALPSPPITSSPDMDSPLEPRKYDLALLTRAPNSFAGPSTTSSPHGYSPIEMFSLPVAASPMYLSMVSAHPTPDSTPPSSRTQTQTPPLSQPQSQVRLGPCSSPLSSDQC